MRAAHLILNPIARRRPNESRLMVAIAWLERHGWRVERRETRDSAHTRELAFEAAAAGMDAVVACGGDGTINQVVNGLAGSDTALAVLPAGTVNVWARETGIGREPLAALRLLVEGERRRVDLGRANGRYFLMLASVGTDSYAVEAVSPALKRRWGRLAYLAFGLRDLLRTGGRPMTITVADEIVSRRVLVAIVGNTRLYGGALRAAHRARIDDGLLDLCLYTGDDWRDLAMHALRTLAVRHERHPGVVYRQAPSIRVNGPHDIPVQVDGEYAERTPVAFSVASAALTVVVPAGRISPIFKESKA